MNIRNKTKTIFFSEYFRTMVRTIASYLTIYVSPLPIISPETTDMEADIFHCQLFSQKQLIWKHLYSVNHQLMDLG